MSNDLDRLMMQADLANKQRREDGMDDGIKTHNDYFISELQDMGLFVRDYDPRSTYNLSHAIKELHRELSKLDLSNINTWAEVKLIDVVNAYAKNHELGILGGGK